MYCIVLYLYQMGGTKRTHKTRRTEMEISKNTYKIQDREAGNEIDTFTSLEEAEKELIVYEKEDKENGIFVEDFYEIVVI